MSYVYRTKREHLMGPWEYSGSELVTPGSAAWAPQCAAWSPQCVWFGFEYQPYVTFHKVWWCLQWAPSSTNVWAKLVSSPLFTDNIAQIQANYTGGPVPQAIEVTSAFETMRCAGVSKNIGMFFWGGGTDTARIYSAYLEIVEEIPVPE